MDSGIDKKREKFSKSEDLERYISGRCTFIITICNSDDATQPHTQVMHRGIKT